VPATMVSVASLTCLPCTWPFCLMPVLPPPLHHIASLCFLLLPASALAWRPAKPNCLIRHHYLLVSSHGATGTLSCLAAPTTTPFGRCFPALPPATCGDRLFLDTHRLLRPIISCWYVAFSVGRKAVTSLREGRRRKKEGSGRCTQGGARPWQLPENPIRSDITPLQQAAGPPSSGRHACSCSTTTCHFSFLPTLPVTAARTWRAWCHGMRASSTHTVQKREGEKKTLIRKAV